MEKRIKRKYHQEAFVSKARTKNIKTKNLLAMHADTIQGNLRHNRDRVKARTEYVDHIKEWSRGNSVDIHATRDSEMDVKPLSKDQCEQQTLGQTKLDIVK